MKKFSAWAVGLAAVIGITSLGAATLAGCGIFGGKEVEVSTYEQLVSEDNSGKKIKLTADIDCGGLLFDSLTFEEFDGQGHTIKNGVISSSAYGEKGGALFGRDVEVIKNLTVENFEVRGDTSAAIIKYGGGGEISDVTVKDCKLEVKNCRFAGGIYAGYTQTKEGLFNSDSEFESAVLTNCHVEKLDLEAESSSEQSQFSDDGMYVGGLAGDNASSVTSCYAINCEIDAKSNHYNIYPYVGGLLGRSWGVSECYSKGNTITGDASVWGNVKVGTDTTCKMYIGGLVGHIMTSKKVEYCYAEDNSVVAKCSGTVYAGGLAGSCTPNNTAEQQVYITQSYAVRNILEASAFAKDAKGCNDNRYVGGLAGYLKYINVSSCFAYDNLIIDKSVDDGDFDGSGSDKDKFRYGGLVGSASTVNFSNCASQTRQTVGDWHFDMFCIEVKSATGCYTTPEKDYDQNAQQLTVITKEDWEDGQAMMQKLALTGDKWSTASGVPVLNF